MPRILKTKDYDLFTFVDFNREINRSLVNNLSKSAEVLKPRLDLYPLIVKPLDKKYADASYPNGKHEIWDGQHKFIMARQKDAFIY